MALVKLNARSATALDATVLTGNLPAISGASLTGISAGKFNQYVIASETSQQTINSSGSFTNLTNVAVTITPSATNSKILLFVETQAYIDHDTGWWVNIDRNISGGSSGQIYGETGKSSYINTAGGDKIFWSATAFTQDTSHSTTSAITYDVGIKTDGEVYMNYHKPSTIMAIEVLA